MVHTVADKADFTQRLADAGDKLVVVDFYATWCGPCKVIAPRVEDLDKASPDVVFLKVDVDQCEDVAAENNISCMPTFLFFKNSARIADMSGANYDKLVTLVNQHK